MSRKEAGQFRYNIELSSATQNGPLVNHAAILCIDDEPDAIKIRKLLLESEGYQVFDATTGEEGLRLFRAHKIDVVVVDYWMSGMNGLAVAREIKKLKPAMPIIMLSGFSELPGEAVGIADRWILKGRSAEDLLDAVSTLTHEQSQD